MSNKIDFTYLTPYLDKLTHEGYFYNPAKLLSYRKPFNVMQTSRSVGKTTVFMSICLLNYLVKGKQFIYCRRTEPETLDGARDFFVDVEIIKENFPQFPIHSVYYEAGKFWLLREVGNDREEIGRAMPLSMVGKKKSVRPKDANIIIYDEFVAMYQREYLGTSEDLTEEYDRLVLLYQSIDRTKGKAFKNETAVFCLGNSTSLYNPVFLGLNCLKYIQKDSHFIAPKKALYVIERLDRVPATDEIEQSFAYLMASAKDRARMYKNDTGEFEGRYITNEKPKKSRIMCNFVLSGKTFGLYYSDYKMLYYIGRPDTSERTYSLDIDGHEMTDTELVYAMKDFTYSSSMIHAYNHGRLYFNTMATQRIILSYLKLS